MARIPKIPKIKGKEIPEGEGKVVNPETGEESLQIEIGKQSPEGTPQVGLKEKIVEKIGVSPTEDLATRGMETPSEDFVPFSVGEAAREADTLTPGRGPTDHGINTDNLDSPDEVLKLMEFVSDHTENAAYRPKSFDETLEGAEKIDEQETIKKLLTRKTGDILNDEQVTKARQIVITSAERLQEWGATITERAAKGEVPDTELVEYQRSLNLHIALQSGLQGNSRDTARALAAHKINAQPLNDESLRSMVDAGGGRHAILAKAKAVGSAENAADAAKMVDKVGLMNWANAIIAIRLMGLLFGPSTHIKNITGNSLMAALSVPERFVGGVISQTTKRLPDATIPVINMNIRGSGEVFPQEALAQLTALPNSFIDGFRMGAKTLVTDKSAFGARKLQEYENPISSKALGFNEDNPFGMAFDWLGAINSVPGRALLAEDEFFKAMAFRMEFEALATRQALSEGLKGDALAKRVHEFMSKPNVENILQKLRSEGLEGDELDIQALAKMRAEERIFYDLFKGASDFAEVQTFTNEIKSDVLRYFGKAREASGPVGKLIIPFYNTIANISVSAIERTPAAPLLKSVRDDLAAGGARADMAKARIVVGSSLMLWASHLYEEGIITGGGPGNTDLRNTLRQQGWQPYSVKNLVTGEYQSYQGLEPVSTMFATVATYKEWIDMADTQEERDQIFAAAAYAFAAQLKDKPFMLGMSDLVDSFETVGKDGSAAWRASQRFAASFQPASALGRTFRKAEDVSRYGAVARYDTDVGGFWDGVQAQALLNMPDFWNRDVPLAVDYWGNDAFYGPEVFSPFYTATGNLMEATTAMVDNFVPMKRAPDEIRHNGMTVKLKNISPEAKREFHQLVGRERLKMVNAYIAKDSFQRLPFGPPDPSRNSVATYQAGLQTAVTQGDLLNDAVREGLTVAKAKFLKKYRNELDKLAMDAARSGQKLPKPLPAPVIEFRNNPQ